MKRFPALHDASFRLAQRALGAPYGAGFPRGGQELIAIEILCLLLQHDVRDVWLPFSLGPLAHWCTAQGYNVEEGMDLPHPARFDALYFGTPTIVGNQALFPESAPPGAWTKQSERLQVRELCAIANKTPSCRVIISGLGSGDISGAERIMDMRLASTGWSYPRLVAWKDFGDFEDSVFMMNR